MTRVLHNVRGSLSLSLLASIAGGCLFLVLFANLVRFSVALLSVQHAAQAAVRCLSPANADCVSMTVTASEKARDWFAVRQGRTTTDWTDRYQYSATLFRQTWETRGNGYQIHLIERPLVEWQAFRLPVVTYRGSLNQYEYRVKTIDAAVLAELKERHYRVPSELAAAGTNFPDFDINYEVQLDEAPSDAWHPRVFRDRANSGRGYRNFDELSFQTLELGGSVITARDTKEFATGYIEIPQLLSNSPAVSCLDFDGRTCDIRRAAGQVGSLDYSWDRQAAIAIKPFASVRRISGDPSIAWAGAPGAEGKHWGLQVEILSAADYQRYRAESKAAAAASLPPSPIPAGALRCLGGRVAIEDLPLRATHFYNLWLRGPKGSNGGSDPNCPTAQNSIYAKHDAIYVERGGAFRVSAFLSAGGSGAVEANVSLRYYYDTYEPYERTVRREMSCSGSVPAKVTDGDHHCAAEEICKDMKVLVTRRCFLRAVSSHAACLRDEEAMQSEYAFPLPKVYCGSMERAAVCDLSKVPEANTDCSAELAANNGRIVCGWMEDQAQRSFLEVASVPAGCAAAESLQRESHCGEAFDEVMFRESGDYGDTAVCPRLTEASQTYGETARRINSSQPPWAVRFPLTQNVRAIWSSKKVASERWAPILHPSEEILALAGDPSIIRKGDFRVPSRMPIYRHRESSWKPPFSAFGFYGGSENVSPSEIQLTLVNESPESPLLVYPFLRSPELEIPASLPGVNCDAPEASLESRLRAYAAKQIPQAAEPETVVQVAATYVDTIATARTGSCSSTDNYSTLLPVCSKHRYVEVQTPICAERQYLGRFSSIDYPSGPPVCNANSPLRCYSESIETGADHSPAPVLDILAAQRKGLEEIHRAFPAASLSCRGPGCAEISITHPDDDHVGVRVSFELPLSFPLSAILARDTLQLAAETTEMLEQSVAGRFAALGLLDEEVAE